MGNGLTGFATIDVSTMTGGEAWREREREDWGQQRERESTERERERANECVRQKVEARFLGLGGGSYRPDPAKQHARAPQAAADKTTDKRRQTMHQQKREQENERHRVKEE